MVNHTSLKHLKLQRRRYPASHETCSSVFPETSKRPLHSSSDTRHIGHSTPRHRETMTYRHANKARIPTQKSKLPRSSSKHQIPFSVPPPKNRIIGRIMRRGDKKPSLVDIRRLVLRAPDQVDIPSYHLSKVVFLNRSNRLLVDRLHTLIEHLRDNPLGYDILIRVLIAGQYCSAPSPGVVEILGPYRDLCWVEQIALCLIHKVSLGMEGVRLSDHSFCHEYAKTAHSKTFTSIC